MTKIDLIVFSVRLIVSYTFILAIKRRISIFLVMSSENQAHCQTCTLYEYRLAYLYSRQYLYFLYFYWHNSVKMNWLSIFEQSEFMWNDNPSRRGCYKRLAETTCKSDYKYIGSQFMGQTFVTKWKNITMKDLGMNKIVFIWNIQFKI